MFQQGGTQSASVGTSAIQGEIQTPADGDSQTDSTTKDKLPNVNQTTLSRDGITEQTDSTLQNSSSTIRDQLQATTVSSNHTSPETQPNDASNSTNTLPQKDSPVDHTQNDNSEVSVEMEDSVSLFSFSW